MTTAGANAERRAIIALAILRRLIDVGHFADAVPLRVDRRNDIFARLSREQDHVANK